MTPTALLPKSPVRRRAQAVAVVIGLLPLLALGCAVRSQQISSRAVNYNVAAEQARNEMLLLNVLRARDRKPMVFTGLSRITGSIRQTAGIGASGTLRNAAADSQGVNANMSVVDSPSFDVAVLDSQSFTRGIMTPLTFELVEYFWDQGFSRDVLFYLAVERIELECRAGDEVRTVELINEVGVPSWDDFQELVGAIYRVGQWEVDPHQTVQIGPPVDGTEVARLGTLLQVAGRPLRLQDNSDGTWRLERPSETLRLVVPRVSACTDDGVTAGGDEASSLHLYDAKSVFLAASQQDPDELKGRVVLRSPQSILFYLGEIMRPGRQVHIISRSPNQSLAERLLFVATPGSQCSKAIITVSYDGQQYSVPDGEAECSGGRAMQSLALAAQLLSLQQSASDLPATGTVRIIGQ